MLSILSKEPDTLPAPPDASESQQETATSESKPETPQTLIELADAELSRLQSAGRQIRKRVGARTDEMETLRARIIAPPPGTTPEEMAALQSRLAALAALVNADKAEQERIEAARMRAEKQREMLDSEAAFRRAQRERFEVDVQEAEMRTHTLRREVVIAERLHARKQAELKANVERLAQIGAK